MHLEIKYFKEPFNKIIPGITLILIIIMCIFAFTNIWVENTDKFDYSCVPSTVIGSVCTIYGILIAFVIFSIQVYPNTSTLISPNFRFISHSFFTLVFINGLLLLFSIFVSMAVIYKEILSLVSIFSLILFIIFILDNLREIYQIALWINEINRITKMLRSNKMWSQLEESKNKAEIIRVYEFLLKCLKCKNTKVKIAATKIVFVVGESIKKAIDSSEDEKISSIIREIIEQMKKNMDEENIDVKAITTHAFGYIPSEQIGNYLLSKLEAEKDLYIRLNMIQAIDSIAQSHHRDRS